MTSPCAPINSVAFRVMPSSLTPVSMNRGISSGPRRCDHSSRSQGSARYNSLLASADRIAEGSSVFSASLRTSRCDLERTIVPPLRVCTSSRKAKTITESNGAVISLAPTSRCQLRWGIFHSLPPLGKVTNGKPHRAGLPQLSGRKIRFSALHTTGLAIASKAPACPGACNP